MVLGLLEPSSMLSLVMNTEFLCISYTRSKKKGRCRGDRCGILTLSFSKTLSHTTYTHRHLAPTHLTQTLLLIQSKLLDPRIENTTSPGGYYTREWSRVRCYSGTGFKQTKFRMSFSRLRRREEGLDGGGGGSAHGSEGY